jgi:hypothetical protein
MVLGVEGDGLAAAEYFRGNSIKAVKPTKIKPRPRDIMAPRFFDLDLTRVFRFLLRVFRERFVISNQPIDFMSLTFTKPPSYPRHIKLI